MLSSADPQLGATSMGQLGRTQKSQAVSEKKLKAYACELERKLEARTRELAEAREQQIATSEMLRVISNLPGNLEPVFQSMLENATRLCEAKFGTLYLREGQAFRLVGQHNAPAAYVEERRRNPLLLRPIAGSALGRVVATKQPAQIADVQAEPVYHTDPARADYLKLTGARTLIAVPMLKENELVGAIAIYRQEVHPFTDKQIELVTNFANQAVIAIENVRLFDEVQARTRELSEALEQQTATSEILGVIAASPTDIQPVLQAVAESACRICEAYDSVIRLCEGELLRVRAHHGPIPVDFGGSPIGRGWVTGRAFVDREPVHVHDLQAAADEFPDGSAYARRFGHRTILAVPLLRENEAIGVLVIRRAEMRPFTDKQIELVTTFADQAVIAIENVRLFEEVQARTRELAQSVEELQALGEVSQAVNSTLDLQTVLSTIVAKAVQLSGTEGGAIYVFEEAQQLFRLRATFGFSEDLIAAVEDQHLGASHAIRQATQEKQPQQTSDIGDEPPSPLREIAIQAGYRARLIVPLVSADQVLGAPVIRRKQPGEFPKGTIHLLQTFAAQSVLAIQNARLFREIGGQEPPAPVGERAQVAVRLQHEPRAAYAAQRHHRAHRYVGHQCGALRHGKGAGAAAAREPRWDSPAWPHQPGARPVEDRGRKARTQPTNRATSAADQRGHRHRRAACRAEQEPPCRGRPGEPRRIDRRSHAAAADTAQPVEQCLQV